jgi:two-component system, chemotaxis family, chemotaxis protein CheY
MTLQVDGADTKVTKKDGTPYRFLLVDDSEFIIKSLGIVVKLLGGEVVGSAHDGNEAMAEYKKCRPDIVTLDIVMPNTSGIDVVKMLKDIDPGANIIMVSSLGHQEMVKEAIKLGAKYFIVKPFKPMDAAVTIKKVIQKIFP